MKRGIFTEVFLLALTACASGRMGQAGTSSANSTGPDLTRLSGRFAGSWEAYAIDRDGRVALVAAWVDTVSASGLIDEPDRVYVTTSDEMTFSGGRIPPQRVTGREGYLRSPDGSLGDYFVESMGRTSTAHHLAPDVWISATAASPAELVALGPNSSGEHVLVKVVSTEQGVETHRISRVTTVHWTDTAGVARSTQYVSVKGEHHRLGH